MNNDQELTITQRTSDISFHQRVWYGGLKRLRFICDYSGISKALNQTRAAGRPNTVFIWIPKTAGTSLVEWINASVYLSLHEIKYRFPGCGVTTFGHLHYRKLIEKGWIANNFHLNAFTFCVVRNPYDRAVSLYHYLKKLHDLPSDCTFEGFCELLSERPCEPIGLYNVKGLSQCNPQSHWLEGIRVDRIIHFESLNKELSDLLNVLHIKHQDSQIPQRNRSSKKPYPHYYNGETKKFVETYYASDFKKFRYKRDIPEI